MYPVSAKQKDRTQKIIERWSSIPCIEVSDLSPFIVSGGTAAFYRVEIHRKFQGALCDVTNRQIRKHISSDASKNSQARTLSEEGCETVSWILKDLAHAKEEAVFYEYLRKEVCNTLQRDPIYSGHDVVNQKSTLLGERAIRFYNSFFCLCPGKVAFSLDGEHRKFLILSNMYQGFKKLRFADLKIGKCTAVANWMGKSAFRAWKNQQIDRITNSVVEG